MIRLRATIIAVAVLLIGSAAAPGALDKEGEEPSSPKGPERIALANPETQNRVHRVGNIWMNITNWGFFGNYSIWGGLGMDDPEYPGTWAPQAEYPANSGVQYLFQGALWLGAMVQQEGYEFPRVSTGTDGWVRPRINEFYPGEGAGEGIVERTTRPNSWNRLGNFVTSPNAISEQDFVFSYLDTLTESFYVKDDPIDGRHYPLGIKIRQKSYAWSYAYARNFIIIDWEVENIAGNYLKNLYVGLYVDADVGWTGEPSNWFQDDICGFQRYFYYERPNNGGIDSSVINTAWIADNDGRPVSVGSGNEFTAPHVTGVRVLRAPNPKLRTSFNWWISNGDPDLDFGPSWDDDGAPGGWTNVYGTPMGDERKYFILSNGEFDYDQVYVNRSDTIVANPQVIRDRWNPEIILESHSWKIPGVTDATPANYINDLANGFDTRYLLSWGPLGIFDHIDQAGNRIYRLNPGEKFSMTISYVAGDNFHNRNAPQPDNATITPALFDFGSLRYNADWAAKVYDNPMIDTDGDGWFGEDVGRDGLFAYELNTVCYVWVGGVKQQRVYEGPDADGSENNGRLEPEEDALERPEHLDYTRLNGLLDFGDGIPDFQGPPPPPVPELKLLTSPVTLQRGSETVVIGIEELKRWVVLTWNKYPSESPEYTDPFSREWDFEGYRVYVSNDGLEQNFALLDIFDRVDFSYFSATDSLAFKPVEREDQMQPDTTIGGIRLYRKPVGRNIGLSGSGDLYYNTADSNYYYILRDAHALVPRYFSVTAYDCGDWKTGTPPLETARRANMIFAAPSGSDLQPVRVAPNPYRVSEDYTQVHGGGVSWENRDDGTAQFFPQSDRRLFFYNLPRSCLIRIYSLSGDLIAIVPHNTTGDANQGWAPDFAEGWDLNSRNHQQVVSGIYLFTVEDLTPGGGISTGKFVVIR
ncbi:MAG: hypothetical protein FJY67_07830 [Calditrichaeota bacterium]|nr:hypothetical protein [Calditrichota bacterium]